MMQMTEQSIHPAAPDALIEGLLALKCACQLPLDAGSNSAFSLPAGSYALVAAVQGVLELEYTDSACVIPAGGMAVLCAEGHYAVHAREDSLCMLVHLCGSLADQLLAPESLCTCWRLGAAAVRGTVLSLAVLDRESGEIDASTASAHAYTLLMKLHSIREAEDTGVYSPLVEAAVGIIEDEFAYLEGLDSLTSRLEVSKAHLIRVFTREVGISPGKYLIRTRIAYARLLLSEPDMTISYAADATGFANANYFAKVFRRETGLSPTEFQRDATPPRFRQLHDEDRLNVL